MEIIIIMIIIIINPNRARVIHMDSAIKKFCHKLVPNYPNR